MVIKSPVLGLLCRWVVAAALLLVSYPAIAQSEHRVYFAGHGFDAQCNQIEAKFQYLSAFLDQTCPSAELSEQTLQFARLILGGLPAPSGRLDVITEGLGSLGAGDNANVLAFVFDGEMVHTERLGETHKLLVEVTAQIVTFDFNSMTIVWSKPLAAQYIDVVEPGDSVPEKIDGALHQLLLGDSERSLPSQFARSLADYSPTQTLGLRLGVEKVTIAPGLWKPGFPDRIEDLLASKFTMTLTSNLGVTVVPPAKTDALNNKMAARMADGAVYTLEVPTSDYPVQISIDDLKKIEADRTNAEVLNVFGVYATFDVGVRAGGDDQIKSIFSEQIKLGVNQRLPITAVLAETSDGLAYYETIEALFDNFTSAVESPSPDWTQRHMVTTTQARDAVRKMNELREVIERCR